MNHWHVLGIEPVADVRLVRRAYAKILKTIDQDLEPQRFIALRNALGHALAEIEDNGRVLAPADDQPLVPSPEADASLNDASPVAETAVEPSADELEAAFHAENQAFFDQLNALIESLLARDFSEPIYQQFVANLAALPHRSLALQLWAYDGMAYALGQSSGDEDKASWQAAERFIRHWWQVRGNELPLAGSDESAYALYARIERVVAEDDFWQQVPRDLRDEMRTLRTESKINYLAMARLAWSEHPFIREYLSHNWRIYPIDNMAQSQNVALIGYLKSIPLIWPTVLMILIAMLMLLNLSIPISPSHDILRGMMAYTLAPDDPSPDPVVALVLFSGFIALLWSVCFQAYISIWVAIKPAVRPFADWLAGAWFSVGLFLSLVIHAFASLTQQGLLGGWLLVGAVVMGYTRYDRPSLFGHLHRAAMGDFDYICTLIATLILFGFIFTQSYLLGSYGGAAASSWVLGLLPIVMLLNADYLHHVLKKLLTLWSVAAGVMGMVIAILIALSDSVVTGVAALQEVLQPLALAVFLLLMGLPILLPPSRMAYAIKYGTYLMLIVLPIYFHLFVAASFGAVMLLCTARHDWMAWRFPKDAVRVQT